MMPSAVTPPSERETQPVSDLPPPPVPPAGPSDSDSATAARPMEASPDWDWDRVRDLAEYWYRPLADRAGWTALGYLALGAVTSVAFFVMTIATASIVFALSFVGVGVVLVNPFFRLVETFARAERAMATWSGVHITPRPVESVSRFGFRAIADVERWRQVGYLALNTVLGGALFAIGSFCYTLVLRVIFDDGVGGYSVYGAGALFGLVAIAVGAVALGAAPRVVVQTARLKAHVAEWFLGPDRLAVAEERVSALSTQRSDILDAVASERRRIERNLHDGVQQQLVAIGLDLGMAEQHLVDDPERTRDLIDSARSKVRASIGELRQLGRGLHPAILQDRGLDAALSAVVSGSPVPISVQIDPDLDVTTDVGETVYFLVSEAVANVLKHARARVASVHVVRIGSNVRVTIHDDGVGGVDSTKGTGIAGMGARVRAVDGTFTVTSPVGGPTTLIAEIPRR